MEAFINHTVTSNCRSDIHKGLENIMPKYGIFYYHCLTVALN